MTTLESLDARLLAIEARVTAIECGDVAPFVPVGLALEVALLKLGVAIAERDGSASHATQPGD